MNSVRIHRNYWFGNLLQSVRAGVFMFACICFIGYIGLLFAVYGVSGKTRTLAMELQMIKNELVVLESERSIIAAQFAQDGVLARAKLIEPNEKSMAYLYIDKPIPTIALR